MTTQIRKDQVADDQIGDAHIDPSDKITEANLILDYPTHSTANDPTTNQKAALDNAPNALTGSNPVVDKQYADAIAAGIEVQDGIVLDKDVTDPSTLSPTTGDLYIVGPSAIGVWSGHDGEVAEWNGASWDFSEPGKGWLYFVGDESSGYIQTQSSTPWSWTLFFTPSDVTAGAGLVKNGAAIDVGAGAGVQVNTDDIEVIYETSDPQAIGTASAGSADEASRGDHVHPHGNQGGGTEHAVSSGSANGFQSAAHYTKLDGLPAVRYVEEFAGAGSAGPFTLSNVPKGDAYVTVYKNGVRQKRGGSDDYTRSGNQITFNAAVGTGQSVSVEYWT